MDVKYLTEIKARIAAGRLIRHIDVNMLLAEVERMTAEISSLKTDKNRLSSENIMRQETIAWQNAEIAALKKVMEGIELLTRCDVHLNPMAEALDETATICKQAQEQEEKHADSANQKEMV